MSARLIIVGAAGRMGRRLCALAPGAGFEVVYEADAEARLEAFSGDKPSVLIDFSVVAQAPTTLAFARRFGVPCVLGTTGLDAAAEEVLMAAAAEIPIVRASNFSVGVTVLLHLVETASRQLGAGWDMEIVEAHHRMKVDSPSGTAISLGRAAAAGRGWDFDSVAVHGREGIVGARPDEAIGMHAVRGGTVVGTHMVGYFGAGEGVTIEHRAEDRDIFARGALRAASWLLGEGGNPRPPGLYDMRDVLGLSDHG